jgi:hypothetical protein
MIKKIINILKENDNNDKKNNDKKNHVMYMLSLDIYEKYFIVLFARA